MPRISIGECSLYYERQGMGFPVLFISGLGGYASFWQEQAGAFAKRFEVITFDHRGIGQSDPARMGYTVERMTVDAIALLNSRARTWVMKCPPRGNSFTSAPGMSRASSSEK